MSASSGQWLRRPCGPKAAWMSGAGRERRRSRRQGRRHAWAADGRGPTVAVALGVGKRVGAKVDGRHLPARVVVPRGVGALVLGGRLELDGHYLHLAVWLSPEADEVNPAAAGERLGWANGTGNGGAGGAGGGPRQGTAVRVVGTAVGVVGVVGLEGEGTHCVRMAPSEAATSAATGSMRASQRTRMIERAHPAGTVFAVGTLPCSTKSSTTVGGRGAGGRAAVA